MVFLIPVFADSMQQMAGSNVQVNLPTGKVAGSFK
jgi:hypothetical protein